MSKFSKNRTTEVQPDRESLLMGIADAVSNDGSVHDPHKYDTVPSPESRLKEIANRQKNKKTDKLLTTEQVLTEASTSLNIGHQSSAIRAPWDGPIPNVGDEVEVTVLLPEGETFTWGGFTYIAAPSFTQKAIAYEGRGGVIKIAFDEDIPIVVDSRTNTTTQGLQYIDFSSDNAIYLKGNSGSGNVGFLGGLYVEITMSIPTSREVIDSKFLPEHLQFGEEISQKSTVFQAQNLELTEEWGLDDHSYFGVEVNTLINEIPKEGEIYTVTFGDTVYDCQVNTIIDGDWTVVYIGNPSILGWEDAPVDDRYPFYIEFYDAYWAAIIAAESITTDVEIQLDMKVCKTIDLEYLPEHLQFGEGGERTVLVEPVAIPFIHEPVGPMTPYFTIDILENKMYIVNYNGVEFKCPSYYSSVVSTVAFGNEGMVNNYAENSKGNGEPFFLWTNYGETWMMVTQIGYDQVVGISVADIKTIDPSYLPSGTKYAGAPGQGRNSEVFNDYAENEATGGFSHAEGSRTKATEWYSHAEGYDTEALGGYSHTEGNQTKASGGASHAEGGYVAASGDYSHAEGHATKAIGMSSHAEGYSSEKNEFELYVSGDATSTEYTVRDDQLSYLTGAIIGRVVCTHDTTSYEKLYAKIVGISDDKIILDEPLSYTSFNVTYLVLKFDSFAYGKASHVEGYGNTAAGDYSHAEGEYTVASSKNQHVQGKYNIFDGLEKYAHIVGNGTGIKNRSNAHTLDWDGNAWFAGGVEMNSPDGTRYRITIGNGGVLVITDENGNQVFPYGNAEEASF